MTVQLARILCRGEFLSTEIPIISQMGRRSSVNPRFGRRLGSANNFPVREHSSRTSSLTSRTAVREPEPFPPTPGVHLPVAWDRVRPSLKAASGESGGAIQTARKVVRDESELIQSTVGLAKQCEFQAKRRYAG